MNKKGFTLVELLVGILILTVGLLAIAGMQHSGIRGNKFGREMTEATTLARDKIEYLKTLGFDDADLTDTNTANNQTLETTTGYDYREANIDVSGDPGGKYTRIWNIADDTPLADTKTVMLVITWSGHKVTIPYIKSRL